MSTVEVSPYAAAASMKEARAMARERFEAVIPQPVEPVRPTMRRAQIVNVTEQHRMWLEIGSTYRGPHIILCQARENNSGASTVSLEELQALQGEISRAIEDYSSMDLYTKAVETYRNQQNRWSNDRNDAMDAAALLWSKAHPDEAGDEEDYDEDDD